MKFKRVFTKILEEEPRLPEGHLSYNQPHNMPEGDDYDWNGKEWGYLFLAMRDFDDACEYTHTTSHVWPSFIGKQLQKFFNEIFFKKLHKFSKGPNARGHDVAYLDHGRLGERDSEDQLQHAISVQLGGIQHDHLEEKKLLNKLITYFNKAEHQVYLDAGITPENP